MHDIPLLEVMIALKKLTGGARIRAGSRRDVRVLREELSAPGDGTLSVGRTPASGVSPIAEFFRVRSPTACTASARRVRSFTIICDCAAVVLGADVGRESRCGRQVCKGFERTHRRREDIRAQSTYGAVRGRGWCDPHHPTFDKGADFARHSGFFIFDSSRLCVQAKRRFVVARSGATKARLASEKSSPQRPDSRCVRTLDYESVGQHDSLALSVADAADVLGRETPEGREFAQNGDDLFDARRRFYDGKAPQLLDCPNDPRLWLCGYTRKNSLPECSLDQGNILRSIFDRTKISWGTPTSSQP